MFASFPGLAPNAGANLGHPAGFVVHRSPLKSGQWAVVSCQRKDSWRPSGHSSPVFRVGRCQGKVCDLEGVDVTKVGGE